MRNESLDALIRKSLSGESGRSPTPCVNENLIAAYIEQNLSSEERAAFESHVSDCAACREILALSMKLRPLDEDARVAGSANASPKTLFRFSIPVPVLGALAIGVVLVAVFFRLSDKPKDRALEDQAALSSPSRQGMESLAPRPPVTVQAEPSAVGEKRLREDQPALSSPSQQKMEGRVSLPPVAVQAERSAVAEEDKPAKNAGMGFTPPVSGIASQEVSAAAEVSDVRQAATPSAQAISTGVAGSFLEQKQKSEADDKARIDEMASIRVQEPVSRPSMFAASNRIATALYTSPPIEASLKFAFTNLSANLNESEAKKIGDRVFHKHSGFWIDKQCLEHSGVPIVEVTAGEPEYSAILGKYPDLRTMLPVAIYWEAKNFLLK